LGEGERELQRQKANSLRRSGIALKTEGIVVSGSRDRATEKSNSPPGREREGHPYRGKGNLSKRSG